jgi:hypothetical protein
MSFSRSNKIHHPALHPYHQSIYTRYGSVIFVTLAAIHLLIFSYARNNESFSQLSNHGPLRAKPNSSVSVNRIRKFELDAEIHDNISVEGKAREDFENIDGIAHYHEINDENTVGNEQESELIKEVDWHDDESNIADQPYHTLDESSSAESETETRKGDMSEQDQIISELERQDYEKSRSADQPNPVENQVVISLVETETETQSEDTGINERVGKDTSQQYTKDRKIDEIHSSGDQPLPRITESGEMEDDKATGMAALAEDNSDPSVSTIDNLQADEDLVSFNFQEEIPSSVISRFDAILVLGGGVLSATTGEPSVSVQRALDDAANIVKRRHNASEHVDVLPIVCLATGEPKVIPGNAGGRPVSQATTSAAYLMKHHKDVLNMTLIYLETASLDIIGSAFYSRTNFADMSEWANLLVVANEVSSTSRAFSLAPHFKTHSA